MMFIENKYEVGDTVYLKTDKEQKARLVTGILVKSSNYLNYELSCGSESSWHVDFEISAEANILVSSTN